MKLRWDNVTVEHVLQAIKKFDRDGEKAPLPRNTYLIFKERKYPAKHIRGMESARRGVLLVRIKHGDFDWEADDAEKYIEGIFKRNHVIPGSRSKVQSSSDKLAKIFDWRSFEIEFQRIRLNYLKWLFYLSPPKKELLPELGKGKSFTVLRSDYGRSFSLSPSGYGNVYYGGKGSRSLPHGVYHGRPEIYTETEEIKHSLNSRVAELRYHLLDTLREGDYPLLWAMLQNFWWIKIGLHEFVAHGGEFEVDRENCPIEDNVIRDYLLTSMYYGADISKSVPSKFTDFELKRLITYQIRWDRYGCCTFDSGPLAWGKRGYVPYSEIAETRTSFNKINYKKFREEDIALGTELRQHYAIDSLKDIYEYGILYHLPPFSEEGFWTYRDFLHQKRSVREVIIDVQDKLNRVILDENLKTLPTFEFIP